MADRPRHFEADIPYVHSTMNNITLSQLQTASDSLFVRIDIETKLQPLRRIKERNRQINHKNTLDVLRSFFFSVPRVEFHGKRKRAQSSSVFKRGPGKALYDHERRRAQRGAISASTARTSRTFQVSLEPTKA